MTRWAILTGEYPPQPGGVSDYTRLIARELVKAGDRVCVYAPPIALPESSDPGVVYRLPGRFGPRSLVELERALQRDRPDRLLVQYVPHSFGWKAINLPFALWLAARASRIASLWVMFHEVAFPFHWRPWTHAVLGSVTPVMARIVADAAERVFVSIPAWGAILKSRKPAEWLPVPCTFDTEPSADAIASVRARFAAGTPSVGHFGTYGALIANLLTPAITELLGSSRAAVLLIGRGSHEFRARLMALHPEWNDRVAATGELPLDAISAHLRACDLLLQPFPDGISSRRTSAMAGLANEIPIVTNLGALSEPLWARGGVAGLPTPDAVALGRSSAALLSERGALADLGQRGAELYHDTFAVGHTIAKLRGSA